jgi:hypothetical protein
MHAMTFKNTQEQTEEEKKYVLTKALTRMAERLQLSRQELSVILGPSESTLCRLFTQASFLDPSSKEGQLAILLLRLYRSLDTLFGGNIKQCQLWLRNENRHLQGKPILLIQSIEGLVLTVQYLDAMRGKN